MVLALQQAQKPPTLHQLFFSRRVTASVGGGALDLASASLWSRLPVLGAAAPPPVLKCKGPATARTLLSVEVVERVEVHRLAFAPSEQTMPSLAASTHERPGPKEEGEASSPLLQCLVLAVWHVGVYHCTGHGIVAGNFCDRPFWRSSLQLQDALGAFGGSGCASRFSLELLERLAQVDCLVVVGENLVYKRGGCAQSIVGPDPLGIVV